LKLKLAQSLRIFLVLTVIFTLIHETECDKKCLIIEQHYNTKVMSSANSPQNRQHKLMRAKFARLGSLALALILAGCGGATLTSHPGLIITPNVATIDTNCTGCNRATPSGAIVEEFSARMSDGSDAEVRWSVRGLHPGAINEEGFFTPPSFLTADAETVVVTATQVNNPKISASTSITITPGFFAPLTPQNIALAPGGTATINGMLAEAGGNTAIHFELERDASSASSIGNAGGELGNISTTHCQRGNLSNTICSVVYTAPATLNAPRLIDLVATVGNAHTSATILVNPAGITSSPVLHQNEQFGPVLLGSTGGHGQDYESSGTVITGCCGGTLGALVEDGAGTQYILSNNHILALSDQASPGDAITQPGLIDNDCSPLGVSSIASLSVYAPLSAPHTNVDAALAQVATGMVDPAGRILELGAKQADGTLAAAAPGISSSGGHGENVTASMLPMEVAKSGRTTGLTCANISAINLDLNVDYYKDCAETVPYLSKTFTNQIAVSGNGFSDAGDSGSLLVDASNAEPIGLYFAGGTDTVGVSQAVANPAPEVLAELNAQLGGNASLSFVGGMDHAVSCLSYGDSTVSAAQAHPLPAGEMARAQLALGDAHALLNPAAGILAVGIGKSSDHIGEAAILIALDESSTVQIPAVIDGVRTQLILTDMKSIQQSGLTPHAARTTAVALPAPTLNAAIAIKKQIASGLMKATPAFFGVGVGQSLDNPREAALVIYVDRRHAPAELPATYNGLRARYILMDRMHVTRSYAQGGSAARSCTKTRNATGNTPSLDGLVRQILPKLN
jgi:hypothetical protein